MKSFDKMRQLLNEENNWPANFTFKFIVPGANVQLLLDEIGHTGEFTSRPSKTGKYTSVTFTVMMSHADKVIEVYKRAQNVPGILSL